MTAPSTPATQAPTFDNNAFAMLDALLRQWGLSSLSGDVRNMLTAGDTAEVIPIKLRETQAYKTRFKGNLDRIRNGLPALSEAEYLATETQLKSVVRRYVGGGTYDTQENLEKWISNDLSPQELNDRMGLYQESYLQQPLEVRDAWAQHGLTPQDAIIAMMDPAVDETKLKRKANIYSLGAESVKAFGNDRSLNTDRLGQLVDQGVTTDRAREGYQAIAGRQENEGFLARSAGMDLSAADQENAALLGDQSAEARRKKVLGIDEARFNENYLGTQSSLAKDRAGTY